MVFPEPLIHNVPPRWRPWVTGPRGGAAGEPVRGVGHDRGTGGSGTGRGGEVSGYRGGQFLCGESMGGAGWTEAHWDAGSDDRAGCRCTNCSAKFRRGTSGRSLIAETSHYGIGRAPWLREIAEECRLALENGVALHGVCLYPILDRFDWEDRTHWHNSGLWDMSRNGTGHYRRVLNGPYGDALRAAQTVLS